MKLIYKVLIVFFVVMFSVIIFLTNRYINKEKNAIQSPIAMESAKDVETNNIEKESSEDSIHIQIKSAKETIQKDFDTDKKKKEKDTDEYTETEEYNEVEEQEILVAKEENKTEANKTVSIIGQKAKELVDKNTNKSTQTAEKDNQGVTISDNKEQVNNENKSNNQESNQDSNQQKDDNATQKENDTNDNQANQNDNQESGNIDNTQDNTQDSNIENQQQENNTSTQNQEESSNSSGEDNENQEN